MSINYRKKIANRLNGNSWDTDFEFEDIEYQGKYYYVAIKIEDYKEECHKAEKESWGYAGGSPPVAGYCDVTINKYSYTVYLNNQDTSWEEMRVKDPVLSKVVGEKAFSENKEKIEKEMGEKIIHDLENQSKENPFDDRI